MSEKRLIDANALLEKLDALSEIFRRRGESEDKGFLAVQCGVTHAICEVGEAPTIDAVEVLLDENARLRAELEAALSDMEALADREANPCDFCDSKGACHRLDSCPRAGYRNFKWRGPQEGANQ